jgi:hypothetical protein
LSAAALTEFVAGTASQCSPPLSERSSMKVTIQVSANGGAVASCSLHLNNLVTLNLGSETAALYYLIPVAGDEAATPPVALMFED